MFLAIPFSLRQYYPDQLRGYDLRRKCSATPWFALCKPSAKLTYFCEIVSFRRCILPYPRDCECCCDVGDMADDSPVVSSLLS